MLTLRQSPRVAVLQEQQDRVEAAARAAWSQVLARYRQIAAAIDPHVVPLLEEVASQPDLTYRFRLLFQVIGDSPAMLSELVRLGRLGKVVG